MARSKNATQATVRINNESTGLSAPADTAPEQLNDEILVTQVARGSSAALEALYDRHAAAVFGVLLRIVGDQALAEEVLQEAFWRVWKSAETYQSQRGTFTSWLFRIARNLAIDAYRRQTARPQAVYMEDGSAPSLEEVPDPSMDVAEQTQSVLMNRQVQHALASLPEAQRQVIEMAYFYGMTRQEIAEATGEALGTIHTRARLAMQKLRDELDKEEFEG